MTKAYRDRIRAEVDMILKSAHLPPCPDPAEGGCMGGHCIYCAAREIRGIVNLDETEEQQRALRVLGAS